MRTSWFPPVEQPWIRKVTTVVMFSLKVKVELCTALTSPNAPRPMTLIGSKSSTPSRDRFNRRNSVSLVACCCRRSFFYNRLCSEWSILRSKISWEISNTVLDKFPSIQMPNSRPSYNFTTVLEPYIRKSMWIWKININDGQVIKRQDSKSAVHITYLMNSALLW